MGDDEVTSSSAASGGQHGHSQIIIADVIVNQTHSDDIGSGSGDVDLDLWDLDLNVNSVYGEGVGPVSGQVSHGHNGHNNVPPAKRTHMRNNSLAISSFSDSSSGI
jgi:hypothetical protein